VLRAARAFARISAGSFASSCSNVASMCSPCFFSRSRSIIAASASTAAAFWRSASL
jgi:hypothetical protein